MTSEIRERGKRVGFTIRALRSGERAEGENRDDPEGNCQAVMAHVDSKSPYRVGRYGVNLSAFEEVGVAALREGMKKSQIIIIDEIGRMELYSDLFQKEVLTVLDCPLPVLGVIQMKRNSFLNGIRGRSDVRIVKVTPENRNALPQRLLDSFGLKTM